MLAGGAGDTPVCQMPRAVPSFLSGRAHVRLETFPTQQSLALIFVSLGGPRRTVPLRGDLARSPPASSRSQERNAGPEGVNNVLGGHSKLGTWGRSQGGVSADQVGEGRVSSSQGREGRQKARGPGHPSLGSLDTLRRVLRLEAIALSLAFGWGCLGPLRKQDEYLWREGRMLEMAALCT